MQELLQPLSEEEMDRLEQVLVSRFENEPESEEIDPGISDLSCLDGFFTAIVSGPETVQPSHWVPAIWGDLKPEWKTEKEAEEVLSLLIRHMNGIANHLMEEPETFEPLFYEREEEGETDLITEYWCDGYLLGIELTFEKWDVNDKELEELLFPIFSFGTEEGLLNLENLTEEEVQDLVDAIAPSARAIHRYWLKQRN